MQSSMGAMDRCGFESCAISSPTAKQGQIQVSFQIRQLNKATPAGVAIMIANHDCNHPAAPWEKVIEALRRFEKVQGAYMICGV